MSDNFYHGLSPFDSFWNYPSQDHYAALPQDWHVVITDIQGSTQAIGEGRYKDVNAIGVTSIMAILNAVKPLRVPYVFGGDGATICIPSSRCEPVRSALIATKLMSEDSFDLKLRIGMVSVEEIHRAGHQLMIAKYSASPHYHQAMFWGEGLGYAEALVKDPSPQNPYLIKTEQAAAKADFSGFECRWNEIPSRHGTDGEVVSVLIQSRDTEKETPQQIFQRVNEGIRNIYGEEDHYRPVCEDNLSLTFSLKKLATEIRVRSHGLPVWKKPVYGCKLLVLGAIGKYLMAKGVQTDATDWGRYKSTLVANSDYQKFDEVLRMILSATREEGLQLRQLLEAERKAGKLVYGMHTSDHALMTCLVFDYSTDHVHFLDGGDGGYAMAAKELKGQIRELANDGFA